MPVHDPRHPATPSETGARTSRRITVAVLNDYQVVVEGIIEMLRPWQSQIAVVEANVRTPLQHGVDVVLYDTYGQEAVSLARVREQLRTARVGHLLVYSWQFTDEDVQMLLADGASGVVSKRQPAAALADAVLRVVKGEKVVVHGTAARVSQFVEPSQWPGRRQALSMREAEMISLICQELTNEQIVQRTGLSMNTVKSYIRSAYKKIDVTHRAAAVRWGFEHDMHPDPPESRVVDGSAVDDEDADGPRGAELEDPLAVGLHNDDLDNDNLENDDLDTQRAG